MGVENNIPEGWVNTTLGEISKVQTGPFGTQLKNEQYITGGTPVITVEHIKDFRISDFDYPSVTNEDRDRLSKYLLKEGDIVFTRVGSVDLSAYVSEKQDGWMFSSRMLNVRPTNQVDSKYISYFFRQPLFRSYIFRISVGATMPSINTGILKSIPISYPPLPEQKAIAKVLTAFDDKIELLQAQNKTLETMAQTIFKEWFGKYQVGDELPEGWRVGEFGEVIEFINGYAFKSKDLSKEPIDNAYKVFKMGDINKGGGFKPGKTKGYFPKSMSTKLNKYILKNGDLLMSMTDMKDAISLLGHTALMIYEDEYIVNQRVGLIRVKNDINIEYPYLYLLTNNDDFIARIRAGANSGVQVNLSTQGIKETEFIIADKETNKAFNNVVMPLFEKRKANSQMIKELKKTRDTLLPKLMSGQVRVNNIKQTANA